MTTAGGEAAQPGARFLGQFKVDTSAERVRSFRTAISLLDADDRVPKSEIPLTFPACWLADPDVRGALLAAIGLDPFSSEAVLVHLEQHIDMSGALRLDSNYALDLSLTESTDRRRFTVDIIISAQDGAGIGRLSTGLALMPMTSRTA